MIAETFEGGPVGLSTLADAIGEDRGTIEDVYEPYLLQKGLLQRTPRGRVITRLGRAHLGHPDTPPVGRAPAVRLAGGHAFARRRRRRRGLRRRRRGRWPRSVGGATAAVRAQPARPPRARGARRRPMLSAKTTAAAATAAAAESEAPRRTRRRRARRARERRGGELGREPRVETRRDGAAAAARCAELGELRGAPPPARRPAPRLRSSRRPRPLDPALRHRFRAACAQRHGEQRARAEAARLHGALGRPRSPRPPRPASARRRRTGAPPRGTAPGSASSARVSSRSRSLRANGSCGSAGSGSAAGVGRRRGAARARRSTCWSRCGRARSRRARGGRSAAARGRRR